jgi:transcription elongation GreA/GreB family factor
MRYTIPFLLGAIIAGISCFGQIRTSDELFATRAEKDKLAESLKTAQARELAMRQLNSRLIELQEELENTKAVVVEFSKDGAVVSEKIPTGSTVHIITADQKLIAVRVANGAEETEIVAQ